MLSKKKRIKLLQKSGFSAVDFIYKDEKHFYRNDDVREKGNIKKRRYILIAILFVLLFYYFQDSRKGTSESYDSLKHKKEVSRKSRVSLLIQEEKKDLKAKEDLPEEKRLSLTSDQGKEPIIEKNIFEKGPEEKPGIKSTKDSAPVMVQPKKEPVIENIQKKTEELKEKEVIEVGGREYKKTGNIYFCVTEDSLEDYGGINNLKRYLKENEFIDGKYSVRLLSKGVIESNKVLIKRMIKDGIYLCEIGGLYGFAKCDGNTVVYSPLLKNTLEKYQRALKVMLFLEIN